MQYEIPMNEAKICQNINYVDDHQVRKLEIQTVPLSCHVKMTSEGVCILNNDRKRSVKSKQNK